MVLRSEGIERALERTLIMNSLVQSVSNVIFHGKFACGVTASRRKMKARAVNICRSGPPPEYAEDSEKDETPLQICKVEYEQGDRLFMTRILLEPAAEDLCATSTISQKLVEEAHRASETWKGLLTLPNCVKGFELVFAKKDFNILPEHRQWDHAIEFILGSEPKSSKVYPLSPVEQKELDSFLEENLCTG